MTLPDPSGDTPPQLRVYDVRGRRVATRPLAAEGGHRRAVRLDVSTWPSGTYFVRLRAGTTTRTERLSDFHALRGPTATNLPNQTESHLVPEKHRLRAALCLKALAQPPFFHASCS